jgi:hypothetical protein
MRALLEERPPDKESPAPLAGGNRTSPFSRSSLREDRGQGTKHEESEQPHDHALALHSRLSDTSWLDALRLPIPCTERHIDTRRRLEARERLLADALNGGEWVSYSRNWNHWPARRYLPFGRQIVAREVEFLEEQGLLEHDRRRPGERGWQSRFRATRSLLLLGRKTSPVRVRGETILLRDEEGQLVDYHDTQETRAMRRRVETLNEALAATVIDLAPDAPVARVGHMLQINEDLSLCIDDRGLHRVFNRSSFRLGGRFYGGFWQSLKAKKDPEKPAEPVLRPYLTIDGERTVELDYSGCHPRMLAAELGVDLGVDPYEIGGNWQREDVKIAMMVLINALDLRSAIGRIAYDLGSDGSRAVQLIGAIKARHPGLASSFHTGAGLRLMRADSDISDAIFTRLLKRGIVALSVHDSYIVATKNAGDLRAEMERGWHAKTGTNPVIK